MRKEIVFATISGLLIGLLVAFGAWRVNSAVKPKTNGNSITSESINTEKVPSPTEKLLPDGLTLSNLEDFDVITKSPVDITGITKTGSFVAISGESEDQIIASLDDGVFSSEIKLDPGINRIKVDSFDQSGSKLEKIVTIVYSNEFAKYIEGLDPSEEITKTPEGILEKVRQKVEGIRKNPKAVIGTVTNKTEEGLQIKNQEGKIDLISLTADTTFVRIGTKTTDVDSKDVAIGDYVAVLGFADGGTVLEAKRVILTEESEIDRVTVKGEIVDIKNKVLTLKVFGNDELLLSFPKNWKGPEIKELEDTQEIITVYSTKDNKNTVRTIMIIPKETPSVSPTGT